MYSYQPSTCVCIGCMLHCRDLLPTQFSGSQLSCFHLFATVWREVTWCRCVQTGGAISWHFSSQTLLIKDRQCCDSWKDAEFGVSAVCAEGDMTDKDRWVDLLCCSPHCDTAESCLMNDMLITFGSNSDCYNDWRQPSLTVLRRQQSYRRCHLLQCVCCSPLAASR